MEKRYILAIDQGTTGTTMLLVDHSGRMVYKYYRAFAQSYPEPGWVEHDPELIWETVRAGLQEILSLEWLKGEAIAAVGLANQRETIVIWERATGRPVYPAIVWQCRRSSERCSSLTLQGFEPLIGKKTGLRLDPYFSATKIEWILTVIPGLKERAVKGELACGTIDSWLIWKLTGGRVHATDYSNASRTMLFNIHDLGWDPELLDLFGTPEALLPQVKPSAGWFGETDPALTGRPIPITGVLGDQQAALFGQGCLEPGMMKNTYGTGCFLLMNTGSKPCVPEYGLVSTIAWGLKDEICYALEGSVFVAGAVIQWLRDELGIIKQAADSQALAEAVPNTGGVYLVPAFTGLGAPHWDPYARGVLIGLTRGTNRCHIVRAALEGIAYQVREVLESMNTITGTRPVLLRVDGGAAVNNFLLQFQADICDLKILRNHSLELTGIGAALCAGLGAGFWESMEQLKGLVPVERTFTPGIPAPDREKLWQGWNRAVERARGWAKE
jgi:glycerol kinase